MWYRKRWFLSILLLLVVTACLQKPYVNELHPERPFAYDDLTCRSFATQQQAAYIPVVTLQNIGYAKSIYDGAYEQCLITLGWMR